MASAGAPKYWFPAKRYGWGWGVPTAWQGRAVLITYLALAIGGIPVIHAAKGTVVYIAYLSALTAVLVVVCWLTGEPQRR